MGLDATVRCRCWEDGTVTPCPFPELVFLDNEGYLNLTLSWKDNPDTHRRFDQWLRTCCPHEDMEYASEHISNWSGYRFLQQRLAEIGWQHFPTLKAELPNANGGVMQSSASRTALDELDFLQSVCACGYDIALI